MKTPQLLGALALLTLPLTAQVSFTGSYSENFNSLGTTGTGTAAISSSLRKIACTWVLTVASETSSSRQISLFD